MGLSRRDLLTAAVLASGGCLRAGRREPDAIRTSIPDGASARLGFGGDVMLGRNVDARWRNADDPSGIWTDLTDRLQSLDGLFANLEGCISNRGEKTPNRGYYFRASPDWALDALEAANATWVSHANNHALDFGPTALRDTLSHLGEASIARAGSGVDRQSAVRPAVVTVGDLTVGVVAFTDQAPLYAASPDSPGTAYTPLDHTDPLTRHVVDRALGFLAGADLDLLVASLHWGPNWTTGPDSRRRDLAHWLVDRGIDVVHGHSAHVFHGVEVYRNRPILYDCGDFVDDYVVKQELRNDRSWLFELVIEGGHFQAVDLVPVHIDDSAVHPADSETAAWLRETMRRRAERFDTRFERHGVGLRAPLD
ncbi:CapA family protein [Halobacteriales archaeon Cl-PHB]